LISFQVREAWSRIAVDVFGVEEAAWVGEVEHRIAAAAERHALIFVEEAAAPVEVIELDRLAASLSREVITTKAGSSSVSLPSP
jgi:hypothetical protein